jgi:hypothetical protein
MRNPRSVSIASPKRVVSLLAVAVAACAPTPDRSAPSAGGRAQPLVGDDGPPPNGNPFGIGTSRSSSFNPQNWLPAIAQTGIGWLRGFFQEDGDSTLTLASANGVQVTGTLQMGDTFPTTDLPSWMDYVATTVGRYPMVRHWEIWNEPPNFTLDTSPASYGAIVAAAYDAAKAVDPGVQIGLAAQSVNVNFLDQALVAGAAGHFDYVTVHPYEMLGLVDDTPGFEAEFLSIVPTIGKLLAARSPAQAAAPVWFTEIGAPVAGSIDANHQADLVVKAYALGIAQGIARVHWFEGIDGDSGPFGLLDASGVARPSYTAMASLVSALTQAPRYVGWIQRGAGSPAYVFNTDAGSVLVAWAQAGDAPVLDFGGTVTVVDPKTGASTSASSVQLTSSPIIASPVPDALAQEARSHRSSPYLWGGDFSDAPSISFTAPGTTQGLHVLGTAPTVTIDGVQVRDCSTAAGQAFTVDPNFLSYTSAPILVTAVVRANAPDNRAGFNLKYESVNGYHGSAAGWYSVPGADQWYTATWTIDDPQFVGKWGYHFSFDSDSTEFSGYSLASVTVSHR